MYLNEQNNNIYLFNRKQIGGGHEQAGAKSWQCNNQITD